MEVINTQHPPTDPPEVQMGDTQQPDAATGQAETTDFIATEAEIEAWVAKPLHERQLTERLRGVLSETALTGVVRYSWTLMRPIVEFALEEVDGVARRSHLQHPTGGTHAQHMPCHEHMLYIRHSTKLFQLKFAITHST